MTFIQCKWGSYEQTSSVDNCGFVALKILFLDGHVVGGAGRNHVSVSGVTRQECLRNMAMAIPRLSLGDRAVLIDMDDPDSVRRLPEETRVAYEAALAEEALAST